MSAEANSGSGPDLPGAWRELAAELAHNAARRVLIVGPADQGKSTLCRSLFNAIREAGRAAVILDADPGQKMLGPPACITKGRLTPSGAELIEDFIFIGSTDPVRGRHGILEALTRLGGSAPGEIMLINSGGMVAGPGHALLKAMIKALAPDLIVALGEWQGREALLAPLPEASLLRLAASPQARRKTDGEKRAIRREAFRGYFSAARPLTLQMEGLKIEEVASPFHAGEGCPFIQGRLASLADAAGRDIALGLARAQGDGALTLLTPATAHGVRLVHWGGLWIDETWRDRPAVVPPPA